MTKLYRIKRVRINAKDEVAATDYWRGNVWSKNGKLFSLKDVKTALRDMRDFGYAFCDGRTFKHFIEVMEVSPVIEEVPVSRIKELMA